MSPTDVGRLVVVTETTAASGGGDRLLRLLRWMVEAGADVELLALSDGPEPADYANTVPVTVLGRLQGPVATAASLLGSSRVSQGLRGRALRRWLASRGDASFLIHHPRAASVLRYTDATPRAVAMFPDSQWSLDALAPADRETLSTVGGWLVCERSQAVEIERTLHRRAIEVGPLLHPDDLPTVTLAATDGAVVLVPTPGSWTSINHTIEIAAAVLEHARAHPVRWVVEGHEDRWLAEHDLVQAGLVGRVELLSEHDPHVLDAVGALVRTGYGASSSALVLAARLAGVPVLGFGDGDVSPALQPAAAFDVEGLAATIVEAVAPGGRERLGVRPGDGFGPDPTEVVAQLLSWLDPDVDAPGPLSRS